MVTNHYDFPIPCYESIIVIGTASQYSLPSFFWCLCEGNGSVRIQGTTLTQPSNAHVVNH